MRSKIILVGRGGAGKDFMRKKFEEKGYKYCVSYTSRPKREIEKEGKDYFFREESFFNDNIDKFYEIDSFNGWKYGRLIEDFEKASLLIMTPGGIKKIKPEHRKKSIIIFIDPDKEILRQRLGERKDADSSVRRLITDDQDFLDFSDYDIRITNHNF